MSNEKNIAFERIISSMHLRKPQKEALECFHKVMTLAEKPIKELSLQDISNLFRADYPYWEFNHDMPEFTFHLATSVGKTRLIGALMAYLYLSRESKHFMIVSPRSEIIRKFLHDCTTDGEKYIFVDNELVDYPTVFTGAHSVRDYTQNNMFEGGPQIWVLPPQAFTAGNAKIKQVSENDSCSTVDYLTQLDDLVIFFDESHHLGLDSDEDSVWRTELTSLAPRMIIGTTGSIEEGQNNIIYSYDIKTCLNEHLYSKFVRMIPEKKPEAISDEDYDHLTLSYGLRRLNLKQKSLDDFCQNNEKDTKIKATMLVACESKIHAEETTRWLQEYLQSRDAVLLVHSGISENEFVPKLKTIENPNSPVKVVVNVGMLNEGWDVSNIYVIVPLRTMASTILVTQIMGRGLRLPFGEQVGDDEVDTLDILSFGRESMQEIVTRLIEHGFGVGKRAGIIVEEQDKSQNPDDQFIPKKRINLNVVGGTKELHIPLVRMNKEPLPLDLISIPPMKSREMSYFLINDPETIKNLKDTQEVSRDYFIRFVTTEVLKDCKYLSYARNFGQIKALLTNFLTASNFKDEIIKLDPGRVSAHVVDCLNSLNKQQKVSYSLREDEMIINLSDVSILVPESYENPLSKTMPVSNWNNKLHKGIPFGGWRRCLFDAVPFDNKYEYKTAHIVDTAEEVHEWFRNLPGILSLETPAGKYSPDFAIFLELDNKKVLLELKDDDRFGREDQDATIKAKAAKAWCTAQSQATGKPWEYWLLLSTDSDNCETFSDIMNNSDIS